MKVNNLFKALRNNPERCFIRKKHAHEIGNCVKIHIKTISLAITFYGCDAESIVDFHLKVKKGKKKLCLILALKHARTYPWAEPGFTIDCKTHFARLGKTLIVVVISAENRLAHF